MSPMWRLRSGSIAAFATALALFLPIPAARAAGGDEPAAEGDESGGEVDGRARADAGGPESAPSSAPTSAETFPVTATPVAEPSGPGKTAAPGEAAADPKAPAAAADAGDEAVFRLYWSNGIRLDTRNGFAKLRLGGRVMADMVFGFEDDALNRSLGGPFEDGVELRRLRFYAAGTLGKHIEFKNQLDFAGGRVALKDAYIGFIGFPHGFGVRIGHFKEPFSLEELVSSKYLTFLERALPNVFAASRSFGVMLHSGALSDGKLTVAAGAFRETDDGSVFRGDDKAYNFTARTTLAPLLQDKGKRLFHVGAAYSFRLPPDDVLRLSARPEIHLSDRLVDTRADYDGDPMTDDEDFSATRAHVLGGELAFTWSRISVQAEYMVALVHSPDFSDLAFQGFYVFASVFATGGHRTYKKGIFGRVHVDRSIAEGGPGALELAARFSWLDLSSSDIDGGTELNATGGANWYLLPNMAVMLNYVLARFSGGPYDGTLHALAARFQVDF